MKLGSFTGLDRHFAREFVVTRLDQRLSLFYSRLSKLAVDLRVFGEPSGLARLLAKAENELKDAEMWTLIFLRRLADLIVSLPSAALRQCDWPHAGSAVTGRIGQNINSP